MNPYLVIIGFSALVIFSYAFNQITKFTKIPSVLLLMGTGILLSYASDFFDLHLPELFGPLKVIGIIGLMVIVLEGALDLRLEKSKWKTIVSSLVAALVTLGGTIALITLVLSLFLEMDTYTAIIYSIPLSVVSSAIVIPSVTSLLPQKREYLIYESTFSDILGIMAFDFLTFSTVFDTKYFINISSNILISVGLSILLSYLLVVLFQKIKTKLKFFLFLSILSLLFAIGKYYHLSALLVILVFGLVLNNCEVFFFGPLSKYVNHAAIEDIKKNFIMITEESSFLIRTFFFVLFGMTMNLSGLINLDVLLIGMLSVLIIYFVRIINLKVFTKSNVFPELTIAPRGLVSILLFYKIPKEIRNDNFDIGILVFVVIITSLVMMGGLIFTKQEVTTVRRKELKTIPDSADSNNPEV